jgi:hypothetical protein
LAIQRIERSQNVHAGKIIPSKNSVLNIQRRVGTGPAKHWASQRGYAPVADQEAQKQENEDVRASFE